MIIERIKHHLPNIIVLPEKITISDACRITISCCSCNKSCETSIRNLVRKWSNDQYLCKSCHVKTYVSDDARVKKFKKTFNKIANTSEHKQKCSKAAKKLWDNSILRKKVTEAVREDNKINPKKIAARKIAQKEWMKKHGHKKLKNMMEKGHKTIKEKCNNLEFRDRMTANLTDAWEKQEIREKHRKSTSEEIKRRWKEEPEFIKKMALARINNQKISKCQLKLYDILDHLDIDYYREDDKSKKCLIGYYAFDCRIDPHPKIKLNKTLLIEVQGDYWHDLPNSIRNDKAKETFIYKYHRQYSLKYIWEHELENEKRIVHLLKYWLFDKKDCQSFDIHSVKREIISHKIGDLFFGKYHYAGRIGRGGVNLGYFLDEKLIAAISYSSPIRKEVATRLNLRTSQVLELSRFSIHPDYQKKNLASFIISNSINYLKKHYLQIKCLVSFADDTYNHTGIIYKASNWILDGEVVPSYWYINELGYVIHKKTLWDKAKNKLLTEKEYANKYRYKKVVGFKKYRYVYQI